ncbi:MAG TPA: hypothetical protein GX497_16455 [Bacillus bacterium]|nr:hypothetical protein [Bacillus sp. (in: firmicutes)]
MAIAINFVSVVVNAQNRNSTISMGEVLQSNWNSHQKSNFGIGFSVGNTAEFNNIINILDSDLIDMPLQDSDVVPSAQNQSL